MSDFSVCFEWMMDNEDLRRQYKTVPDDPPGAHAISGINSAAFPVDFREIDALPWDQRAPAVKEFYMRRFWNTWIEQVASDNLAKRVFDASVNMGQGTAVRILQNALAECARALTADGRWGPTTVAAANACNPADLTMAFIACRCQHYRDIVENNPAKVKYLDAWLARAKK
jgi:lysozyme family protein